jgi:hypothetical protein
MALSASILAAMEMCIQERLERDADGVQGLSVDVFLCLGGAMAYCFYSARHAAATLNTRPPRAGSLVRLSRKNVPGAGAQPVLLGSALPARREAWRKLASKKTQPGADESRVSPTVAASHDEANARAVSQELARIVGTAIGNAVDGATAVGFAWAGLETSRAASAPSVDVVVMAPLARHQPAALDSCQRLRLQTDALESSVSQLKATDGLKFIRLVQSMGETTAVFEASPSLGLHDDPFSFSLSANNATPLYHSTLTNLCCQIDPMAKALLESVTHWTRAREICNDHKGHLSPYGWTQLVIFFLQTGQSVLPSLECQAGDIPQLRTQGARVAGNRIWRSAANCFQDFVSFYSNEIDWRTEAISVRKGYRATPSSSLQPHVIRPNVANGDVSIPAPTIEDPYEPCRNLGGQMIFTGVAVFHEELKRADRLCKQGTSFDAILRPRI